MPISGFWAIRASSMLSVEISSGILFILSLGLRGLCMCVSILSPSLSFILFVSASASWLLPVSICTLPSLSVLIDSIPTFSSAGLICDFIIVFIVSAAWLSLDVTVSLHTRCAALPSTASEYNLTFSPPGCGTLLPAWQCVLPPGSLDGSSLSMLPLLSPLSRTSLFLATFFPHSVSSLLLFSLASISLANNFLRLLTVSNIIVFSSLFMFPLLPVVDTITFRAFSTPSYTSSAILASFSS